jgi:hypothetical protein
MKKIAVKFKNPENANEFASTMSILEDRVQIEVLDGSVSLISDDAIAMAFAKNTIDDIKEEIYYLKRANVFLKSILEAIKENKKVKGTLLDGTNQVITPENARVIANAYDNLSEANQTAYLIFASENKQSYQNAINFAKANEKE